MLTLEQAIASYEKSAERYHKSFLHCKAHGGEFYQEEAESNKICYEHDRQLAAWLRELQERRKQQEIVLCKDCVNYHDTIDKETGCLLGIYVCDLFDDEPPADWYCGDGTRRTNEC